MLDPRKLRPSELCRLLNSTPLGEVINERQLHRHRARAGLRIGDSRYIDLIRYVAWLIQLRHAPRPEQDENSYEKLKARARARNLALSLAGRDIGELPPVSNSQRRARAALDFRFFCEQYFPLTFSLPWSDDHLRVVAKIEQAVLHGGLFAVAMPRGSGKTTICECACIWALLCGHREFVCLIGASEEHATEMLDSIKTELETNDLLEEDFPEVVYPIQRLDGIVNRCNGQLYRGERTHIMWTSREVVLPTIRPHGWLEREDLRHFVRDDGLSKASGAIIRVAGITGRIRGMKHKRADGRTIRPSLVVIDDPQTDESAKSLSQCAERERILAGAILGLAGPGKKISGIMTCTVIRAGDMADNILNREKHPEWNGERTKMVYSFPKNEELWRRYAEIRAESLARGNGGVEATEFYRQNQEAMDEGAVVAWPARYNPDEISAIQHAMNLKLQDEAAFFAEYQNEPVPDKEAEFSDITPDQICRKLNRQPRGTVPLACNHVTAFIDVQANLLYYLVTAWEDNFTGYIIDYGTFPDQNAAYFSSDSPIVSLAAFLKSSSLEGAVYSGLERLVERLCGNFFPRQDGAGMRIERCLIDANWGNVTDLVYQFCQQSAHSAVLTPSHGRYVGAASRPFSEYRNRPGDRVGHHWRLPNVSGRRAVRYVLFDTNYWKSFVHARLATPIGERGCLSLFGDNPARHRLLADHLTSEIRIRVEARGRKVDEWRLRPNRENHWFDCLTGCAVAASMQGISLPEMQSEVSAQKRLSFAELQRRRREKLWSTTRGV